MAERIKNEVLFKSPVLNDLAIYYAEMTPSTGLFEAFLIEGVDPYTPGFWNIRFLTNNSDNFLKYMNLIYIYIY